VGKLLQKAWRLLKNACYKTSFVFLALGVAPLSGLYTDDFRKARADGLYEQLTEGQVVLPSSTFSQIDELQKGIILHLKMADADIASLSLEVSYINNPTANAYALPDGRILITTGMLSRLETSSQLAGVLGHEITHIKNNHYGKRLGAVSILAGTSLAAFGCFGLPGLLVALPVSYLSEAFLCRTLEYEADENSVDLLRVCGYDYNQFGTFLGTRISHPKYRPPLDDIRELTFSHPIIYKRALRVLSSN